MGACALLAALLGVARAPTAPAADSVAFRRQAPDPTLTNRIIVKWRDTGVAAVQAGSIATRARILRQSSGIHLSPLHTLFGRTDVVALDYTPTHEQMQTLLAQIQSNPAVEYAEPDGYRYIQAFPANPPNDPHFLPSSDPSNASNPDLSYGVWYGQWYLQPSSATTPAAIDAVTAWKTTIGAANVIVAVLDTGVITNHPDLAGKLQLPGFDFVSCDQGNYTVPSGLGTSLATCTAGAAGTYYYANELANWHADASDPGDWMDTFDVTLTVFQNAGCTTIMPSSWHGTKVAGVIGAVTDNGIGIAGVAPLTTILPVRVLGRCAARVSDIAAAIMWAAGQPVVLAPASLVSKAITIAASPGANIINISLGANTPCSLTEQFAISTVINAGVLVVAAAGNEGGALDAPANCFGVVSVVGLRETGTKVPYSSLSSPDAVATIAAPGGNCVNFYTTQPCLYDIETTTDEGITVPSSTPGFYTYSLFNTSFLNSGANFDNEANVGTSFAAPMVSGVAALMLAAHPGLTPAQLVARLQSSALAFPTSSPTSSLACLPATNATDSNGNYVEPPLNAPPPECVCSKGTCGAGMLNAQAAVQSAQAMFAQIILSSNIAAPGQHVHLDGSGSTAAAGDTIVSYQWTTDPPTSGQLIDANSAQATLVVPTFRSISVVLTVTDSAGHTATASARIQSAIGAATGAGAWQPSWLALLALAAAGELYRRRSASRRRALN